MKRIIPVNSFLRRPVGCAVGIVLAIGLSLFAFIAFFIIRDAIVYRDVIRSHMENRTRPVARLEQPQEESAPGQSITSTLESAPVAPDSTRAGNPDRGREIFNTNACHACHSLNANEVKVGPSLYGIWPLAGTRKPGMSASDYLRESIVEPNAFVVPNFNPGIMPAVPGKRMNEQEIADLIAFMQRDLNQE